jgi:hypothetical protein
MHKIRLIFILIFLIWTSCNDHRTQIGTALSDDYKYYEELLASLPLLMQHWQIKLPMHEGYLVILNAMQCQDCGKSGIDDVFREIDTLQNVHYIFISDKNDYIGSKLARLKDKSFSIIYDKEGFLYRQVFYYPRQLIVRHKNKNFFIYKVFH